MHESEKNKVKSLSRVRLLATPWTAAHQAPPSMGFSRQEYWSGVPLPSPPHNRGSCFFSCHQYSPGAKWHLSWMQHLPVKGRFNFSPITEMIPFRIVCLRPSARLFLWYLYLPAGSKSINLTFAPGWFYFWLNPRGFQHCPSRSSVPNCYLMSGWVWL